MLQGTQFKVDAYLLPLGSCDMVLGIQWLETLGVIKWDFKQLRMEFNYQGKRHVLIGSTTVQLKTIKGKQLNKFLTSQTHCNNMQLYGLQLRELPGSSCAAVGVTVAQQPEIPDMIQLLLNEFPNLFEEPTGLPPSRIHDHRIPLKEGVATVNVRPYKHSSVQKDVIERMTQELLDAEFVQVSHSPFSSPIVLVKKKDGS